MRRRPRQLEVSTFPFLAVLLCTMGSLILLLLVLDRRAKVVAVNNVKGEFELVQAEKARREHQRQERQAEDERLVRQRQAEWQERSQQLHALLAQQEEELLGRIEEMRGQVAAANVNLEAQTARAAEQNKLLDIAKARLFGTQHAAQAEREATAKTAGQSETAKRELDRQILALAQLEQTLANLKALRERQKNTYSLVPYLGRRGDNRRPIYLECANSGVVFHPDHTALDGIQLTPERLCAEVEQRIARQQPAKAQSGAPTSRPYLLMLVRPDGIQTYYRTQQALAGLEVDFGYEFIEQNWALDFPVDGVDGSTQHWMAANKLPSQLPVPPPPDRIGGTPKLAGPGNIFNPPGAVATGSGSGSATGLGLPGAPGGPALAGSPKVSGFGGGDKVLPGIGVPAPPGGGNWPGGGGGPGIAGGISGGIGGQVGVTAVQGDAKRGGGLGPPGAAAGGTGTPGPAIEKAQGGGTGGSPVAMGGMPQLGAPAPKEPGTSASAGTGSRPASMPNGLPPTAAAQGPGGDVPTGTGQAGKSGQAGGAPQTAAKGEPGTSGGTGNSGTAGTGGSASAGGEATGGVTLGSPLGLAGKAQPEAAPTTAPATLGRVLGNRDWPIYIECNAEGVVVKQGNQKFALESMSTPTSGEHPLVQTLRQMIARRQATVRAGEAPYRPLVRFQVLPDGFRAYYLAYPLLEPLHLPMMRESLKRDSPQ